MLARGSGQTLEKNVFRKLISLISIIYQQFEQLKNLLKSLLMSESKNKMSGEMVNE